MKFRQTKILCLLLLGVSMSIPKQNAMIGDLRPLSGSYSSDNSNRSGDTGVCISVASQIMGICLAAGGWELLHKGHPISGVLSIGAAALCQILTCGILCSPCYLEPLQDFLRERYTDEEVAPIIPPRRPSDGSIPMRDVLGRPS